MLNLFWHRRGHNVPRADAFAARVCYSRDTASRPAARVCHTKPPPIPNNTNCAQQALTASAATAYSKTAIKTAPTAFPCPTTHPTPSGVPCTQPLALRTHSLSTTSRSRVSLQPTALVAHASCSPSLSAAPLAATLHTPSAAAARRVASRQCASQPRPQMRGLARAGLLWSGPKSLLTDLARLESARGGALTPSRVRCTPFT